MPVAVRIYAFAKELGIDNKDLLEVCRKVGIKGKGSALANLEDDEIAKIQAHLAGPDKAEPAAAPLAPVRNPTILSKAVPIMAPLPGPATAAPEPAGAKSGADGPGEGEGGEGVPPQEDAPEDPPRKSAAAGAPLAPGPLVSPLSGRRAGSDSSHRSPLQSPLTRPTRDLRQPLRDLADVSARRKPAGDDERPRERTPTRRPSSINVSIAAMPEVKQPRPGSKTAERVQKPDIALPQDAILQAKAGGMAPLEQFARQSRDKAAAKKKEKPRVGDAVDPAAAGRDAAALRAKARRGKGFEDVVDSELASTRQQRVKRRDKAPGEESESDRPHRRRSSRRRSGPSVNTAAPRKDKITIEAPCAVRIFSEAAGIPAVQVLLTLPKLGDTVMRNINSSLDEELLELLIDHFQIEHLELESPESLEDQLLAQFGDGDDVEDSLLPRPPIVTFLGHVDHGKTSLLDSIIGIDVVSGEAGGITQHIRAYQIENRGRRIAFVDTPGHEAFTEMRARGANVTDIAVLVVAADDGVMPQTEEAISHARAAKVPIIVAMNKVDLPGANPDKVLQDLATHGLLPSEWGGDVEVVRTSALKKTGIDELLETILLTADLQDFRANPDRDAFGTCLEAEQQPGRGVIAKVMVQAGTLRNGDIVVCGAAHGRVKAMYDTLQPNRLIEEAGPSTPVNLTGLDIAPEAGDKFHVLQDIGQARELALSRGSRSRQQSLGGITTRVSLEEFQQRLETGTLGKSEDLVTLNLIIRADVRGSIEALQKELSKIEHPEIRINILQALVGGITIADVRLAQASQAVIIGFNVVADEAARSLAEELQVQIRRYEIIYKVSDDIRATLEGRLKPDQQVVEVGMAMVLQTFSISKTGVVAGCRVMRGTIQRDCRLRLIRESRVIGEYPIDSLKREKDDAREVQRGMECGIKLAGFNDIKEGDTFEAYRIEEVARTLS